ncbi:MAG TPA: type II secretion system major pseudopilin GspG [Tahibacter sp.]|uniref:type II secretion system major pseudopilin GspG n=1 Tax=Tahibacter sp. TaxID=2056211 RepID=UPI002BC01C51|nr:type II secretion system major pseudopilin GspG [Tahibacter sp.]HSX61130.1 type II secretion system major pseudopilin GspG [Tahibacter sp.]
MKYTFGRYSAPRGQSGFSLLEMLAVIVLIGIVAGIVVNQVSDNVTKGKYNAGKAQVAKLSMSIEAYALDNGSPPDKLQDLVTKPGNAPNWKSAYAKESDLKDPFGHAFDYKNPGEHGDFDLVFLGKDGKSGGDKYNADIGNWQ